MSKRGCGTGLEVGWGLAAHFRMKSAGIGGILALVLQVLSRVP